MCLELFLYPSGRTGVGGGRHRSSEDGASVWPNDGITVTFGLVRCLRQRRPRHAVAKTTGVLRSGRERYRLVRLLSYWTYAGPDCRIAVDIVGNVVGVSQGSVLRPILFLLYVADLLQLVKRHGLHPHCYADDSMSS